MYVGKVNTLLIFSFSSIERSKKFLTLFENLLTALLTVFIVNFLKVIYGFTIRFYNLYFENQLTKETKKVLYVVEFVVYYSVIDDKF